MPYNLVLRARYCCHPPRAVFELRGDYKRAFDYIHLDDPGSEWARTHLIELFLRQGREREAVEVGPTHIPQWESFNMLRACAALQLLKRAIQGNYCSYPAIDSDPFFASVRAEPEFADIRPAAIACQKGFLAERQRMQQTHQ